MAITQDYILKGGLRSSDDAANARLKSMDEAEMKRGQQAADMQKQGAEDNAKLAQLLTGKRLDRQNSQDEFDAAQKAVSDAAANGKKITAHIGSASYGETDSDPMGTALKRQMLQQGAEDRQDRIKGRETNNLQNYYSAQGGKDYAKKIAVLQKANDLFQKGDPESLRAAELELSQGLANNALTQNEYNALTTAHGAGNTMQAGAKNMAQIVQNVVPDFLGGDKLANYLGERAANMKTMTPAEIKQKQEVAQRSISENKQAADAIRGELQQRAPQLAPSMYRHDPRGLNTVIDTLGARIPNQGAAPSGDDKLRSLITGKAGPQAAPSGPKPGDVVDGYRFMGGDPSDQKSWSR